MTNEKNALTYYGISNRSSGRLPKPPDGGGDFRRWRRDGRYGRVQSARPVLSASRSRSRSDLVGRRAYHVCIHLDRAQTCAAARFRAPVAHGRVPLSTSALLWRRCSGLLLSSVLQLREIAPVPSWSVCIYYYALLFSLCPVQNLKSRVGGERGFGCLSWMAGETTTVFFTVALWSSSGAWRTLSAAGRSLQVPAAPNPLVGVSPGARRHARARGAPPRFARVVPARLTRPGCVFGSMGPGALPSISSTSPRSNISPHHGHPLYMQIKTGDYITIYTPRRWPKTWDSWMIK